MTFKWKISKLILVTDSCGISWNGLKWMSLTFTDDKSTLVQVMAWCRQAISHYLSQRWPRSLSEYGITRPQVLTNWGREKTAVILPMKFSNSFSLKRFSYFYFNFSDVCFLGSSWQYVSIGSGNGLVLNRQQSITWSNIDSDLWHCVASVGHNELRHRVDSRFSPRQWETALLCNDVSVGWAQT